MDIAKARTTPLGYGWDPMDLEETYSFTFGAIAWPGKDQGFGLVIGVIQDRRRHDRREYHILAECESWNTRNLLLKCLDLQRRYRPERWTTSRADAAADEFTHEIRNKYPDAYNLRHSPALFATEHPGENPYSFLIPKIEEFVAKDNKWLYLKDSKIAALLPTIRPDEIATLASGTYPAIEALGFSIIEARENTIPRSWADSKDEEDDLDDEDGLAIDIPVARQPGT